MSECIDTNSRYHWEGGWRGCLRQLFGIDSSGAKKPGESAAAKTTANVSPPASAPAMMMASRDIGPLISRTAARLGDWQTRQAGRRQLMGLDDRLLKDIGITRCDAEQEYRKPFWRA